MSVLVIPSSIIKWNRYYIRTESHDWESITFDVKQTIFEIEVFGFLNSRGWNRGGSTIPHRETNPMMVTAIGVCIGFRKSNECHVNHWHCSAFISKCYDWQLKINKSLIICLWPLSNAMPRTASSRGLFVVIQNLLLLFPHFPVLYYTPRLGGGGFLFLRYFFVFTLCRLKKSVHICKWISVGL